MMPEDRKIWDKMIEQLDKHEQGHFCFALETFEKIKQEFLSVSGVGKTQAAANSILNANILKLIDDEEAALKVRQTKYDDETNHGRINIEQEKYNKLISEKCNQIYPKE
jgi:predicted secreted Zn-dependent protease